MADKATRLGIPHTTSTMDGTVVLECVKCHKALGRQSGVMAWVLRVRLPIRGVCSIAACKGCLSELMAEHKRMGCHLCTREVVVEQMQLLRTELELKFDQIMLVHVNCSTPCRDRSETEVMRIAGLDVHRACGTCGKVTDQRCSGCGVGMFCTRECMKKGWDTHKVRCKAIRHYNEIAKRITSAPWGHVGAVGPTSTGTADAKTVVQTAVQPDVSQDVGRIPCSVVYPGPTGPCGPTREDPHPIRGHPSRIFGPTGCCTRNADYCTSSEEDGEEKRESSDYKVAVNERGYLSLVMPEEKKEAAI